MNRLLKLAFTISAATTLAGCAAPGVAPDRHIADAKALDQKFLAAFSSGDVNSVMATYWNSPDVVFIPADGNPVQGFDDIKNGYTQMFSQSKGATLELSNTHYIPAGEDVFAWGSWKMQTPVAGGSPTLMQGSFTELISQRDGKWVYIVDHPSIPYQPSPPIVPAK